jgi:hypothetical protein
MTPIEKQREKVAKLEAELQRSETEATQTTAAHTDFLVGDDSAEGGFGSAKAAALLRKAGEARVHADAMSRALAEARKQVLQAERAEEDRMLAIRWRETFVFSDDRLTEAKIVAELCAQLAVAYPRFLLANQRMVDSMPTSATVDRVAGYMQVDQISALVRIELARCGASFVASVDQPHLVESLAERFTRAHKWIRSMATGA